LNEDEPNETQARMNFKQACSKKIPSGPVNRTHFSGVEIKNL
jgi:hypothetical protein